MSIQAAHDRGRSRQAPLYSVCTSIYKLKRAIGCTSVSVSVSVSVAVVWTDQLRAASHGRPSDSFSSLWAAFKLTAHINALYNDRVWKGRTCNLNQYDSVKNIAFIQVFCVESMQSMRVTRVFTVG